MLPINIGIIRAGPPIDYVRTDFPRNMVVIGPNFCNPANRTPKGRGLSKLHPQNACLGTVPGILAAFHDGV